MQLLSTGSALFSEPVATLLLVNALAFGLLLPSVRLWWIHGIPAFVFAVLAVLSLPDQDLALYNCIVGLALFPALCRRIRTDFHVLRYGILWFSLFALISAIIAAFTATT